MFVSKTLVVSLHASTSGYDVAFYEMVVGQVQSVLRESRGMAAEYFLPCGRVQRWSWDDQGRKEITGFYAQSFQDTLAS